MKPLRSPWLRVGNARARIELVRVLLLNNAILELPAGTMLV